MPSTVRSQSSSRPRPAAVRCFGYLLLDKEHESLMMDQFSYLHLDVNGDADRAGATDMRSRFLSIVKEFDQGDEPLRARG